MKIFKILQEGNSFQPSKSIISAYNLHLEFLRALKALLVEIKYKAYEKCVDFIRQFETILSSYEFLDLKKRYYLDILSDIKPYVDSDLNNYLLKLLEFPDNINKEIRLLLGIEKDGYEECQKRSQNLFMSSEPVRVDGLNVNFSVIDIGYLIALLVAKKVLTYLEGRLAEFFQEVNFVKPVGVEYIKDTEVELDPAGERNQKVELINSYVDELVKALGKIEYYLSLEETDLLKRYTQELYLDNSIPVLETPLGPESTRNKINIQELISHYYLLINRSIYKNKKRHPNLPSFLKKVFAPFSQCDVSTIYKKLKLIKK